MDSFDDISDKDIEDNLETAENTIQTNIDRGMLNKNRRVNMKAKTKTTIPECEKRIIEIKRKWYETSFIIQCAELFYL